jgi:class 3 adenylate cyclase
VQFFAGRINFSYYRDPVSVTTNVLSLQSAFVEAIIGVEGVAQADRVITPAIVNTSHVLNIVGNLPAIGMTIDEVRELVFTSMTESHVNMEMYTRIALGIGVPFITIIFVLAMIVQVSWVRLDKREAYRCLISLPKSAVSDLAQTLKAAKVQSDADGGVESGDINGQEENMLKLFNTAVSQDHSLGDIWWTIIANCVLIATDLICLVIFVLFVLNTTSEIRLSAPHAYYACDIATGEFVAMYAFQRMILAQTPYAIHIIDDLAKKAGVYARLAKGRQSFDMLRFGDDETQPFPEMSTYVARGADFRHCFAEPAKQEELLSCMTSDALLALIEPVIMRILAVDGRLANNDTTFEFMWHSFISPVYSEFLLPLRESILPLTVETLDGEMSRVITVAVMMLIVDIMTEVVITFHLKGIGAHIRSVLRLMLGVPAEILMSSPKIMNVISGDFSPARSDSINRDTEFLEAVYMALPVAVLCADSEKKIITANFACSALFAGIAPVGQDLQEFFSEKHFEGIDLTIFTPSQEPRVLGGVTFRGLADECVHLQLTVATVQTHTVVFVKECNVMFECRSIVDEAARKRDDLLSRILPAPLVRKFHRDGKRGSNFAVVQSASLVFINFEAFSEWSASVPATTAIGALNALFESFDAVIATKPLMMKVKTMGDVYMAAGGVFCEVNSPHEHATEALLFGLEAVAAVARFNETHGLSLSISVGQHIGGPVFVGVIGPVFEGEGRPALDDIIRPTFEIIGPAVATALQLVDTKGIPGRVVMSRPVYSLIDRSQFSTVERSAVVGGNANVADDATYVANPRT